MWALQQVAKKLHKKDLQWWVKNCGRFVSTKLGPVVWLTKHGVVQKLRKKKAAIKKVPMKKKKAANLPLLHNDRAMKKKQKKPPQARGWEKLDFGKVGGDGAYVLVGMGNRHMNAKVEELLQKADSAQKKTRHASDSETFV